MRSLFAGLTLVLLFAAASPAQEKAPPPTPKNSLADEVNNYRSTKGLPPLIEDQSLTKAAQAHADDMAKGHFLSHKGSNNSTFFSRAKNAGFPMIAGGEIIAPDGNPHEAVELWKSSRDGHNQQMLTRTHKYIGAASSGGYSCVVFGSKAVTKPAK